MFLQIVLYHSYLIWSLTHSTLQLPYDYLNKCDIKGELWDAVENKAIRGAHTSSQKIAMTITDAGFKDSQDATMCSRLATYDGVWTEHEKDDFPFGRFLSI